MSPLPFIEKSFLFKALCRLRVPPAYTRVLVIHMKTENNKNDKNNIKKLHVTIMDFPGYKSRVKHCVWVLNLLFNCDELNLMFLLNLSDWCIKRVCLYFQTINDNSFFFLVFTASSSALILLSVHVFTKMFQISNIMSYYDHTGNKVNFSRRRSLPSARAELIHQCAIITTKV